MPPGQGSAPQSFHETRLTIDPIGGIRARLVFIAVSKRRWRHRSRRSHRSWALNAATSFFGARKLHDSVTYSRSSAFVTFANTTRTMR